MERGGKRRGGIGRGVEGGSGEGSVRWGGEVERGGEQRPRPSPFPSSLPFLFTHPLENAGMVWSDYPSCYSCTKAAYPKQEAQE